MKKKTKQIKKLSYLNFSSLDNSLSTSRNSKLSVGYKKNLHMTYARLFCCKGTDPAEVYVLHQKETISRGL